MCFDYICALIHEKPYVYAKMIFLAPIFQFQKLLRVTLTEPDLEGLSPPPPPPIFGRSKNFVTQIKKDIKHV